MGKSDESLDHIDHDGLHNYRSNMRSCTQQQNGHNSRANINSKTGFKGVYIGNNKYMSSIICNGVRYHIGTFSDPIEAAHAHDKRARELHGEFAYLNFPDEQ